MIALRCFSSCHTIPFSHPIRLRPTAAASNPQFSLPNSQICGQSNKLTTTSTTDRKKRRPPCVGIGNNDIDHLKDHAMFFDENGAVEDMDGYLNYLSLDYDSVWDTKPSWCQPWTIVSTGLLVD